MARYVVYVDDNFHYMDESERSEEGEFPDYESALQACKAIVDDFLESAFKPGMTPIDLHAQYTAFGEDPWISLREPDPASAPAPPHFSAWDYARKRCVEICEGASPGPR